MRSTSTTDVDPVGIAGRLQAVFVMPSADVNRARASTRPTAPPANVR